MTSPQRPSWSSPSTLPPESGGDGPPERSGGRRCRTRALRERRQFKAMPLMPIVIEHIYAHHTGRTDEQVHRDIERDRFFRPEEALEYGLIDEVIASH
jgi:Clp protease